VFASKAEKKTDGKRQKKRESNSGGKNWGKTRKTTNKKGEVVTASKPGPTGKEKGHKEGKRNLKSSWDGHHRRGLSPPLGQGQKTGGGKKIKNHGNCKRGKKQNVKFTFKHNKKKRKKDERSERFGKKIYGRRDCNKLNSAAPGIF